MKIKLGNPLGTIWFASLSNSLLSNSLYESLRESLNFLMIGKLLFTESHNGSLGTILVNSLEEDLDEEQS